jgi:toxin FitB
VSYLLDTCVISELASKHPEPAVVRFIEGTDPEKAFLSALTVGEIQKGIEKARDPRRKEFLEAWLRDDLLIRFRDQILFLDIPVLRTWGSLTGRLERQGTPMPAVDSLIAATALHHQLVLVTRNVDDFVHSGVQLLNSWDSAES